MKYEWRKRDKDIYLPKKGPVIQVIKPMNYITIKGAGTPGDAEFSDRVQALYGIAYGIKMSLKTNNTFSDYVDYTVFPLEGLWDLSVEGRKLYKEGVPVIELKEYMEYKMMLRQPDFVTKSYFEVIKQSVYEKKKSEKTLEVIFETIDEGLVCQMIHIGSYDSEPASFHLMEQFCLENGYSRISKQHKEIYLTRPNDDYSKMKTTLRMAIQKEKHL